VGVINQTRFIPIEELTREQLAEVHAQQGITRAPWRTPVFVVRDRDGRLRDGITKEELPDGACRVPLGYTS
jgi:hypothetical protein